MGTTGKLENTALVDLLYLLSLSQATGGLLIKGESIATINFHAGELVYVGVEGFPVRLGDRMVDEGFVTDDQLKEVLVHQQRNKPWKPLGLISVDKGFLSETDLAEVVHRQMAAMAKTLLEWKRGLFKFEAGEVTISDPISLSLFHLLSRAVPFSGRVINDQSSANISIETQELATPLQEIVDSSSSNLDLNQIFAQHIAVKICANEGGGALSTEFVQACFADIAQWLEIEFAAALKSSEQGWLPLFSSSELVAGDFTEVKTDWLMSGELWQWGAAIGEHTLALSTNERDNEKRHELSRLTEHFLTSLLAFISLQQ